MTQLKGITFLNTGLSDCNLLVPYCVPVPLFTLYNHCYVACPIYCKKVSKVTLVDDEFQ